ncbi:MFS transporter, partial [archaeon SCG-AAA382B04]
MIRWWFFEKNIDNKLGFILATAFFGMMGGALMGPVLPALIEPFGVGEGKVGLVLGVYTFATAVTMPFVGVLIDKVGRKQVLVFGLIINGVFGSLCSLSPDFSTLLMFRALQGIGIAGLMPVAM